MPRKRFAFVVAATALAIVASACGDSSTSPQDLSAASPATRELERFLIRANEAPGFAPSGKPLASSLRVIAAEAREQGEGPNDEARLSDHGFEVRVGQVLEGPSDAAGASSVQLFVTKDGATRELDYLVSQIGKLGSEVRVIERFDVPGVPTASGWTSEKAGGGNLENKVVVANFVWSQGRCVLGLGSEPAFADRLSTGVKAIYERTAGRCP